MKKMFIHVAPGFKEAQEFDRQYYASMSTQERLSIMQELREMYQKFSFQNRKEKSENAGRKRLRRVVKVL